MELQLWSLVLLLFPDQNTIREEKLQHAGSAAEAMGSKLQSEGAGAFMLPARD